MNPLIIAWYPFKARVFRAGSSLVRQINRALHTDYSTDMMQGKEMMVPCYRCIPVL